MKDGQLQRWSREVAEDAGSPSFVPLARAFRRQGRHEAAMKVVLRGLRKRPQDVAGHLLLALLHVDAGDRQLAGDEWDIVLRLDPGNFSAHRGLGFLSLERGRLADARRHLEAAAGHRPDDESVAQALRVLERRETSDGRGSGGAPSAERGPRGPNGGPAALFAALGDQPQFAGGLVLDDRGLVLAGALDSDVGDGETLGALINTTVEEARRASEMLGLGAWDGLLLECENAQLHVSPGTAGTVIILAARSGSPAGWVVRTAERARDLVARFVEAQ